MAKRRAWTQSLNQWLDTIYSRQHQPSSWWLSYTLLMIGVMAALLLSVGPLAQTKYAWDITLLFDGAYRIASGLTPHTDYSSPIGYFPQGWLALAMALVQGKAYALVVAQTTWLAVLMSLTWFLAARRLSLYALCGLFGMLALLTLCACYPDKSPFSVTYAGIYNRMGWGAFLLIVCYLLVDPIKPLTKMRQTTEALVIGLLAVVLVLTKANFALALAFLFFVALLTRRLPPYQILWIALGGLIGLLYVMVVHRYDPLAHFRDTLGLLSVEREQNLASSFLRRIERNLFSIIAATAVMCLWYKKTQKNHIKGHFIFLLFGVWGAGLIVASGNSDGYYLPFLGLSLLFWLSHYRESPVFMDSRIGTVNVSAWVNIVGLGIVGKLAIPLFLSTYMAFINTAWGVPSDQNIKGFPLPDTPQELDMRATGSNQQYREYLALGSSILASSVENNSQSVWVVDWINPFNWLQNLPPTRNDILFWHVGHVVDDNNMPDENRLLDTVDFILIPKYPLQIKAKNFICKKIQKQMSESFSPVSENDYWWLYKKIRT